MTNERILWLSQDLAEQFDVWVKQFHTDWAVCFGAFFFFFWKSQIEFSPSKSRWTFRQNIQNKHFTERLWKLKHKTKREGGTEKNKGNSNKGTCGKRSFLFCLVYSFLSWCQNISTDSSDSLVQDYWVLQSFGTSDGILDGIVGVLNFKNKTGIDFLLS